MKVPYSWLRAIVPGLPADPTEVAQRLSDSGTYVEAIHEVGVVGAGNGAGEAFKVGKVVELEQHPDADKLKVAKVDVGDGQLHQIVCGAPNVAQGETVAVVLPGGEMPGGMKIREAKLRGVESRGMMMSERELELSTDHSGLMLLDPSSRSARRSTTCSRSATTCSSWRSPATAPTASACSAWRWRPAPRWAST